MICDSVVSESTDARAVVSSRAGLSTFNLIFPGTSVPGLQTVSSLARTLASASGAKAYQSEASSVGPTDGHVLSATRSAPLKTSDCLFDSSACFWQSLSGRDLRSNALLVMRELRALGAGLRKGGAGEDAEGAVGLDPTAVMVKVGVDADGAGDGIEVGRRAVIHGFEEAFEDAGDLAATFFEETRGVSVAIDGEASGETIILSDFLRAAPANELGFDGVAVGMRADGAATGVAGKVRHVGGFARNDGGFGGCQWGEGG